MTTYTELLPAIKSEKHGALKWEPATDNAASPVAGVLTLTGKRNHCRYRVEEFPADMPGRAFMLFKFDAGTDRTEERYAVFCGADGSRMCECRGFAATRSCKHTASVAELIAAKRI